MEAASHGSKRDKVVFLTAHQSGGSAIKDSGSRKGSRSTF